MPAGKFKSRHPDRVKVCLSDLYLFITTKVPKKSAKIARVPGLLSFKIYSAKMDLSKTWYLDITLQDSTTGKPIRRRIKKRINEYATVSERLSFAEAYREKLTQLLLSGYRFSSQTSFDVLDEKNENLSPDKLSLQDAIQSFYDGKVVANRSRATTNRIGFLLSLLKEFEKNHRPILLKDVTSEHCQALLDYIQKSRNIEGKTYNHYRATLSSIFVHYIKKNWIKWNPVLAVAAKSISKGNRHYPLTLDQIRRLKEIALREGDSQFVLYMYFCFYTLIRPGDELHLLQVGDLDDTSAWVQGKNAKKRVGRRIKLAPPLQKLIQENGIMGYPKDHYIFSAFKKPFPKPAGVNYFYKRQKKYLHLAGLDAGRHDVYCFKHSGAIHMHLNGATVVEIMHLAGHSNPTQTMDYLHNLGAISNMGHLERMPEI